MYLSKFDKKGLKYLGLTSFNEFYNVVGYSLGIKPASIKNYRDEFDPYFPNAREGWHKREMRDNCKEIYEVYAKADLKKFVKLLKKVIYKNDEIDFILEKTEDEDFTNYSFAKRLTFVFKYEISKSNRYPNPIGNNADIYSTKLDSYKFYA